MNWIEERKQQLLAERRQREIDNALLVEERASFSDYQKEYNKAKKQYEEAKEELAHYEKKIEDFKKEISKLKLIMAIAEEDMEDTLIGAEKMGFKLKRSEDSTDVEYRARDYQKEYDRIMRQIVSIQHDFVMNDYQEYKDEIKGYKKNGDKEMVKQLEAALKEAEEEVNKRVKKLKDKLEQLVKEAKKENAPLKEKKIIDYL